MKRLFSMVAVITLLALPVVAGEARYGRALELDKTTSIADILANPGEYEGKTVQVRGPVQASCTGMGCWMRLEGDDGHVLLVRSSDESVLVPTDIAGRTAVVEGVVVIEGEGKAPTCPRAGEEGHACPQAKVRLETKGVVLL